MRYKRTVKAGVTTEVKEYHAAMLGGKNKRVKKFNITPECMRKNNYRIREERLRWLMNQNFEDGKDALVTFSFKKGTKQPEGYEEMREIVQKLTRKIRKEWKNDGLEARYIYCMEIGPRGSRHIHMILNDVSLMRLIRVWGHEVIDIKPLNTNGQYRAIAAYFVKYSDKTAKTTGVKLGRCYNSSHNLKKPEIKREVVFKKVPKEPPEPPKGFYLEKDSVRKGITLYNGLPFIEYCFHSLNLVNGCCTHARGNAKEKAFIHRLLKKQKLANAEKHPCERKLTMKTRINKGKKGKESQEMQKSTHAKGILNQIKKGVEGMKKIIASTIQKNKEKRKEKRYTRLK